MYCIPRHSLLVTGSWLSSFLRPSFCRTTFTKTCLGPYSNHLTPRSFICIIHSADMETASVYPNGLWGGEDRTGPNFTFSASNILCLLHQQARHIISQLYTSLMISGGDFGWVIISMVRHLCREHHSTSFALVTSPGLDCKEEN